MKKLILILSFLAMPLSAFAQDAFYLSGMLGLTTLDVADSTVDYDTELSFGARGGLLFNDHVSAGLYINRYATDVANTDVTVMNIMGEVTYYFEEADENTFWLSGLLGLTNSEVGTSDNSDTAFGFAAGYHFMVAPNFSLSPQFSYIYTDADGGSFTQMSGIVNLTVWL